MFLTIMPWMIRIIMVSKIVVKPASLALTVKLWVDSNNDGVADTQLLTTTTTTNGAYQFTQLDANLKYIVQFVPPTGRVFTLKDAAGSTESTDSDANATGYTDARSNTRREW